MYISWSTIKEINKEKEPTRKTGNTLRKRPNIRVSRLRLVLFEHQGAVPFHQALTFSGGARFIAWHLRYFFLGGCRRGSGHFWNHWVCGGYGPTLSFHNKKGHVLYSLVLWFFFDFCKLSCILTSDMKMSKKKSKSKKRDKEPGMENIPTRSET